MISIRVHAGADLRVEIQWDLCDDPARVLPRLGLDPVKGGDRLTTLFETRSLELYDRGVVIRLRETSKEAMLTFKIEIADALLFSRVALDKDADCEIDLHGQIAKQSCKFNHSLSAEEARDLRLGRRSLEAVAGHKQLEALRALTTATPFLRSVMVLGPRRESTWSTKKLGFDDEVAVEYRVLGPARTEFEISTRESQKHTPQTQRRLWDELIHRGIRPCEKQVPKTRDSLSYLISLLPRP